MRSETDKTRYVANDVIIKEINEKAMGLRYGTILIKVHNSKIIQLEVTERTRFDDIHVNEEGGGI